MPMLHGALVVAHERADRGKVVAELLRSAREHLAEARPGSLERIAPAVDDARAGQHRHGRPEPQPVARQLVGENRLAHAPARGALEVAFTEAPPVARIRLRGPLGQRLAPALALLGND